MDINYAPIIGVFTSTWIPSSTHGSTLYSATIVFPYGSI